MRVLLYILTIAIVNYSLGCGLPNLDVRTGNEIDTFYHKQLAKVYSPDKTKYLTITENGTDTSDAHTQVLLNFKYSGAGIYSVPGINKKINAYWKGNSTIVIETFKHYEAHQKWPQIQSFHDIVKIEYAER